MCGGECPGYVHYKCIGSGVTCMYVCGKPDTQTKECMLGLSMVLFQETPICAHVVHAPIV